MFSSGGKLVKCQRCGKYKRRLFNVNNMLICLDCIRGIAFHNVFKDGLRDPALRGDIIMVGIDVGNMTWNNPFAMAWLMPLMLWYLYKVDRRTLTLEDLKIYWRYRTPLEKVLKVYQEEGIFKVVKTDNGKEVIAEGDALGEMLKKYGDRPDVYEIVGAWVHGLIISRLHGEADAPDFRAVYAIVDFLAEKAVDSDGNIVAQPYDKVTGYRCTKCNAVFTTKDAVRSHVMQTHRVPSDETMMHVKEESTLAGYLLELRDLLERLQQAGIKSELFLDRMEKFGILYPEDPDVPRIVERDGKRYIVIDPAWIRTITRVRTYERELIRGQERGR